jgi:hypothetical protein
MMSLATMFNLPTMHAADSGGGLAFSVAGVLCVLVDTFA